MTKVSVISFFVFPTVGPPCPCVDLVTFFFAYMRLKMTGTEFRTRLLRGTPLRPCMVSDINTFSAETTKSGKEKGITFPVTCPPKVFVEKVVCKKMAEPKPFRTALGVLTVEGAPASTIKSCYTTCIKL